MNEEEQSDYEAQLDENARGQYEQDMNAQAEQEAIGHNIDEIRNKITEKLKELATTRKTVEDLDNEFKIKKDQWEKEHSKEIDELSKAKESLSEVEEELRALALSDYAITREKKLTGGIGIRVMKKLEYEEETAFNWASKKGIATTLDKRVFESFVKTQEKDLTKANLEFVKIVENAIATIPKEIKIE